MMDIFDLPLAVSRIKFLAFANGGFGDSLEMLTQILKPLREHCHKII